MRKRKQEPKPAIDPLAVYDEAVKRFFDHTTEQFREFHSHIVTNLRRRMKAVTEELERPYSD